MKKPLPQFKQLEYSLTLPLSQKKVIYRPYNVADERNLIAASAARDTDINFYVENTLNVISGVVLNDIDIRRVPSIDVRYLLLNQRAKSVGEVIEFEAEGKGKGTINLEQIRVVNPRTKDDYKIDLGGGLGLKMRDMSFEEEVRFSAEIIQGIDPDKAVTAQAKFFYETIISSVEAIYDTEDAWVQGEDITRQDVEEFINQIPTTVSKKLYDFIMNVPYIEATAIINGKEEIVTSKEVDFLS